MSYYTVTVSPKKFWQNADLETFCRPCFRIRALICDSSSCKTKPHSLFYYFNWAGKLPAPSVFYENLIIYTCNSEHEGKVTDWSFRKIRPFQSQYLRWPNRSDFSWARVFQIRHTSLKFLDGRTELSSRRRVDSNFSDSGIGKLISFQFYWITLSQTNA